MLSRFLFLSLLSSMLFAEVPSIEPGGNNILVNNRILLKINNKPVTVVDVVKKMDLIFYRQFSHLIASDEARYEFYMNNFRLIFSSFVNDMLVLADAEEKEVNVSDGDVREELETLFGPDVVDNIDKLGLAYDEAWELIKKELIVRQMNQMMVRSKAINDIQPKNLIDLYQEYVKTHPSESEWSYHIITARGIDKESVEATLNRAYTFLYAQIFEKSIALSQLACALKEEFGIEISFSEEYIRKDKEISSVHKKALQALAPMSLSRPIVQENQKEGSCVGRLFFLKEHNTVNPPSFPDLEDQLHKELIQKAIARHGEIYSQKLRDRYGINNEYLAQMIPENFVPFAMR